MHALEIDSLEQFDALFETSNTPSLRGVVFQSLDLTDRSAQLAQTKPFGSIFLGCKLTDEAAHTLRRNGGLVFPQIPNVPFNPYRPKLYSAKELYQAFIDPPKGYSPEYSDCLDAQIHAWRLSLPFPEPLWATLAQALHDHSIQDALDDLFKKIKTTKTIGIMGGHGVLRDAKGYLDAALLASNLTQSGFTVATGGGPGAMEAVNLGGYLAGRNQDIVAAISVLSKVPCFKPDATAWVREAMKVRKMFPSSGTSIGIPTWFYGHEPPNAFASHCAKYFSNALREDALLSRCRGGIVYLEGRAGTVQEIFQTATANYYGSQEPCPMVLVGEDFWMSKMPAWPLLKNLSAAKKMAEHIYLVDSIHEAAQVLISYQH